MPHGKPPALPRVATTVRPPLPRNALPRTGPPYTCGATGNWSWPLSQRDRRCCRVSRSQPTPSPRPSLVRAEHGSATLVAVAMMAALLALTVGGVYVGSAVIARHRAQGAADLAALAAAAHLADGSGEACVHAASLARAMRTTVTQCAVEDLDVIVTVDASVALGRFGVGPARATARAGPVEDG